MIEWIKVPMNASDLRMNYLVNDREYLLYYKKNKCLSISKWNKKEHYFYNIEGDTTIVHYPDYFAHADEINLPTEY